MAFQTRRGARMRATILASALPLAFLAPPLEAGQQICGDRLVPETVRVCPDGALPVFAADEVKPTRSHDRIGRDRERPDREASSIDYFLGVWRTRVPGAAWSSPTGYAGYDWQHARTGLHAGDLIIKPDGTFVWNAHGGTSGRWEHGDREYPVVLVDTAENRRWRIAADPRHTGGRDIVVLDGDALSYDGRR
jgi:hypothetical protein